jgi:hypothetical protein
MVTGRSTNFLEFVARVDGRGGFAVIEADDVAQSRVMWPYLTLSSSSTSTP